MKLLSLILATVFINISTLKCQIIKIYPSYAVIGTSKGKNYVIMSQEGGALIEIDKIISTMIFTIVDSKVEYPIDNMINHSSYKDFKGTEFTYRIFYDKNYDLMVVDKIPTFLIKRIPENEEVSKELLLEIYNYWKLLKGE